MSPRQADRELQRGLSGDFPPRRVILLSIGASVVTMALKLGAFLLTGSVSLLSDAMESSVNLIAALVALIALTVSDRPADRSHAYGHEKAEYFASGFEGSLILVAAALIIYTAVERFMHPSPLADLQWGLTVAVVAAAVNLGVSRFMLKTAKRYDSITLEADARHLMTDVWTSAGVVVGLVIVAFVPEWTILDPVIAILVGLNIIRTGIILIKRSIAGLMDSSLPPDEVKQIEEAIRESLGPGSSFHGLRTRKSGSRRFAELHVTVHGAMAVTNGHDICERIEEAIRDRLPKTSVSTHLEPAEEQREGGIPPN